MQHRRFVHLLLTGLMAVLLATPVFAGPPDKIELDDTFIDRPLSKKCGFRVETHISGMLIIRTEDGLEATTGANYEETFTNLETGTAVTLSISGVRKITVTEDEDVITVTLEFYGQATIVEPGEGSVYRDLGLLISVMTIDPKTGKILSEELVTRGQPDPFLAETLCALLTP